MPKTALLSPRPMPSVLANEDQPMNDGTEGGEDVAAEPQDGFIDMSDRRIRVVSR